MSTVASNLYNQICVICGNTDLTPYDREDKIRDLLESVPFKSSSSDCSRSTTYTFNDFSTLEELYDEDFGGALNYRTESSEWVGIEFNSSDAEDFMSPEEEEEYLRYREEGWSN